LKDAVLKKGVNNKSRKGRSYANTDQSDEREEDSKGLTSDVERTVSPEEDVEVCGLGGFDLEIGG
jgi:hypothetical protein